MSLSNIASTIKESCTLRLNEQAAILRLNGEPVIHLGGGEPKSKPPAEALLSAIKLISTGEVRYTPADGIPDLKKAIIGYTEKWYDRKVELNNVIASGGAKQAIMVALQSIVNPGDEVVFPAPYWVSYPEMAKLLGGVPVVAKAADGSFYLTINDIEKVVTNKTKVVIINSPNNPSGAYYSEQFVAEIVEFCEKRDLYLIMDDIYHLLLFDGNKPVSAFKYAKNLTDSSKLIIINGVSKAYAMTGFRIGWAIASKELARSMCNIQGHQTSGPSIVGQVASIGALNGSQTSIEELRASLEANRDILYNSISQLQGIKVSKPNGTFYCFPDFSHFEKDSKKLSQFLLEKVRVLTVPGAECGFEGHLRLSTCGATKDIIEGIDRIKWALDPNSAKEIKIGDKIIIRDWL